VAFDPTSPGFFHKYFEKFCASRGEEAQAILVAGCYSPGIDCADHMFEGSYGRGDNRARQKERRLSRFINSVGQENLREK
jgi:hypothetical protein